jgi:hypothetical protein
MDTAASIATRTGLPQDRRADVGNVRLGSRDVAGLLSGDMYGAPITSGSLTARGPGGSR